MLAFHTQKKPAPAQLDNGCSFSDGVWAGSRELGACYDVDRVGTVEPVRAMLQLSVYERFLNAIGLLLQQSNWYTAFSRCREGDGHGGHLAKVETQEQQDFLSAQFLQSPGPNVWIGATELLQGGTV